VEGKLTLTVVTPEYAVVDRVSCDEVTLPAYDGQIGILPGHTPLITLLGIGPLRYREGGKSTGLAVREGFAEIAGDDVRVLADRAVARASIDRAAAEKDKHAGEERLLTVVGEEELAAVDADIDYASARLAVADSPT
jgi:F-type H+-transporting ATPase subunit epsilon